MRQRNNCMVLL